MILQRVLNNCGAVRAVLSASIISSRRCMYVFTNIIDSKINNENPVIERQKPTFAGGEEHMKMFVQMAPTSYAKQNQVVMKQK